MVLKSPDDSSVRVKGKEKGIKTIDFNITKAESLLLYKNGEEIARTFLMN